MKFKAVFIFLLAALPAFLFAEEADAQAAEPVQENVELENELKYVEALIDSGFPDFATIVSEEVKKRWPESEARLFSLRSNQRGRGENRRSSRSYRHKVLGGAP